MREAIDLQSTSFMYRISGQHAPAVWQHLEVFCAPRYLIAMRRLRRCVRRGVPALRRHYLSLEKQKNILYL